VSRELGTRLSELLEQEPGRCELAQWLAAQGPPGAWLAAGCVNQLVWNHLTQRPANQGLKDFDIVYFDPDWQACTEQAWSEKIQAAFPQYLIEVKNQARVHLWYPRKFAMALPALFSVRAALGTWPTTATATAARWHQGQWQILAPFGLADLFKLVVRPNRTLVTEAVYLDKTQRWQLCWPELQVLPFAQGIGPFEINGPLPCLA